MSWNLNRTKQSGSIDEGSRKVKLSSTDIHLVLSLNFQKTVHFFKSLNLNDLNLYALKLKY